ncbi:MAG: hypothetical protein ICV78_09960 [Tolypothrix sp. Co-bin9]|nr:hypothetical protein [Tolypothrix sp. Co-bin9]
MIYLLFAISLLTYLFLKSAQSYYEYFSIKTSPRNDKDKRYQPKNSFSWTPKIIVWSFLKSSKPNWTIKSERSVERKLSIVKSFSHFFSIFCIVAFVFSLLQFWLDTTTQIDTTKATILIIEETQFKIKDFANIFKIAFGYDILIMFLLLGLASSFPLLEQFKIKEKLKKYNKAVKSILYFLTISTSFTFFGNRFTSQEEGRVGQLEIHKLQILEDNKLLLKKINEAVTEKVVHEIIANPQVVNVLDKIEEVKNSIEVTKQNDDYINFAAAAPPNLVTKLSIAGFESNFNSKFNFENDFAESEEKFKGDYKQNTASESDYYKSKDESEYSNFKKRNKWYDEGSFTKSSAKQAKEAFASAYENVTLKSAKYYSKYKEPIEKLIKKGYSNTGGKWVKNFFEALGVDLPFLDELIDPIINSPIEDYITRKTESIFKNCTKSNREAVKSELSKCSKEFETAFNAEVNSSKKFAKLNEQLSAELTLSREILSQTKSQIEVQLKNTDSHLSYMCSKSRWERIRQSFLKRVNTDYDLDGFSYSQKQIFKKTLNDWNSYKQSQKFNWYFNSIDNLEEQFFYYSKNNGNIKAAWGFILQQEDWNGARIYYTLIRPERATGQPYYLLKYYYNSIGKVNQEKSLYDNETDKRVGELCPH